MWYSVDTLIKVFTLEKGYSSFYCTLNDALIKLEELKKYNFKEILNKDLKIFFYGTYLESIFINSEDLQNYMEYFEIPIGRKA
jgi:inorganic pyrophosphatase/exopolyphosphatase